MGTRIAFSAAVVLGGAALLAVHAGSEREGTGVAGDPAACAESPHPDPMAGVSLVAPRRPMGPEIMDPLGRVEATWVGVLPFGFTDGTSSRIRFDVDRQWWGETAEGTAAQIRFARGRGLRVMVKPHVWVRGSGWVGDFLPGEGDEGLRWEESYRDFILTFARVAETAGADLFVVGTELDLWARERPEFWRDLIHRVREIYDGPLTYAANWDAFHLVPFWDELDYIGVDAYEALFRVWWDRPWFAGGFLWKWFPGDGEPAGPSLADYTPQHKPVEEVIRDWYGDRD